MLLLPYDLGLSWFSQFCSISEQNRTQSNKIEQNRTIQFDYVRFLFDNRTHKKFRVRFCSIAEHNRIQSNDYVRLFSIEVLFDFVRLDTRA